MISIDVRLLEEIDVKDLLANMPDFCNGNVSINGINVAYSVDDMYVKSILAADEEFWETIEIDEDDYKYVVMQGNLRAGGNGDYWVAATFDTLEEAKRYMAKISQDTVGICKFNNGYLQTYIELCGVIIDSIDYRY